MTDINRQFGRRVRELREGRGWSLTELARRYKGSRSYLYQVERGLSSPSLDMVMSLANALGYPVLTLLEAGAEADEAWKRGYDEGIATVGAKLIVALSECLPENREGAG